MIDFRICFRCTIIESPAWVDTFKHQNHCRSYFGFLLKLEFMTQLKISEATTFTFLYFKESMVVVCIIFLDGLLLHLLQILYKMSRKELIVCLFWFSRGQYWKLAYCEKGIRIKSPRKTSPRKIPSNAVEREPVPTRVINPNASEGATNRNNVNTEKRS